jgi:hypothetical protein
LPTNPLIFWLHGQMWRHCFLFPWSGTPTGGWGIDPDLAAGTTMMGRSSPAW